MELTALIEALRALLLKGPKMPRWRRYGICFAVQNATDSGVYYAAWRQHKTNAFKAWSEYSGNLTYPIKGGEYAYVFHREITNDQWVGTYGNARRRLLRHLICYFIDLQKAQRAYAERRG